MRMIKGSLLLLGMFCFMAISVGFVNHARAANKHEFSIGLDAMYMDYEESGYMEIEGDMYGVVGKYTYNNIIMSEASLRYMNGGLDYKGRTWGGLPAESNTDDWIFEGRYLLGINFGSKAGIRFTPFIGGGYRHWNDDIRTSGGYEREVEYLYSPIGAKFHTSLPKHWSLMISGEYDHFWGGRVKSHLRNVVHGINSNPEVDQDEGYGLKLSATLEGELGTWYALAIKPYFTYWHIKDSEYKIINYQGGSFFLFEPKNKTKSFGCRISLMF